MLILTCFISAIFTPARDKKEIKQSYPIPGSRYVGGYIGVGLETQETERLLHSATVLIWPPPGASLSLQRWDASQTWHKLDDTRRQ